MRSALFVGDGDDRHLPRALHRRPAVDGQHGLPIRGAVQQSIDVVGRLQFLAVDRQDVIARRIRPTPGAASGARSSGFQLSLS